MPPSEARRTVTRAELVAEHAVPLSTLKWLYRSRDTTGHPEAANPGGKPLAWYEDEWVPWYAQYQRAPGQGRPAGTPSRHAKAHPYAGDERLTAVLGWLGEGRELSARTVQGELAALGHQVSPSVAARILTVAKSVAAAQHPVADAGPAAT
ncbi:hypothetical protein KDL01_10115 [Actinospica durhamensis]|uniref:Uncharacterized protein n=1 Tax=Actinospica durhamensis TaxID=1508375 RepID=A0A941EMC1_9ACTN|nr:hypothetical protein [Actinospica durhamensis]MBR7833620.1 hypothetical protein [Actinospica durhamensis]